MSFYKRYILLNLNEYDAFGGFDFYVSIFIAALTVLICIGVFISNTRKNTMVNMVKQLHRHEANSEERAKTLKQLHVKNTFILRRLLSEQTRLSRVVLRVGAVTPTYEEYVEQMKAKKKSKRNKKAEGVNAETVSPDQAIDYDNALFYLSSEKEDDAKNILSKSTTTLWQNVLLCVFFISLSVCLIFIMPEILDLANSLLS